MPELKPFFETGRFRLVIQPPERRPHGVVLGDDQIIVRKLVQQRD